MRYAVFSLLDSDADGSPIVLVHQHRMPIRGTGTQLLLACRPPTSMGPDDFDELFDTIAEGITVVGP